MMDKIATGRHPKKPKNDQKGTEAGFPPFLCPFFFCSVQLYDLCCGCGGRGGGREGTPLFFLISAPLGPPSPLPFLSSSSLPQFYDPRPFPHSPLRPSYMGLETKVLRTMYLWKSFSPLRPSMVFVLPQLTRARPHSHDHDDDNNNVGVASSLPENGPNRPSPLSPPPRGVGNIKRRHLPHSKGKKVACYLNHTCFSAFRLILVIAQNYSFLRPAHFSLLPSRIPQGRSPPPPYHTQYPPRERTNSLGTVPLPPLTSSSG